MVTKTVSASGQIPATKNLMKSSEAFNASPWIVYGLSSITANSATDPLGGTTAEKLVPTLTHSNIRQEISLTFGQTYTFSVWLRGEVGGESANLQASENGGDSTQYGSSPITLTTTWTRYSMTFTKPADTTQSTRHWIANLEPGSTVWAWGAQLEVGSVATDYDPAYTADYTSLSSWWSAISATADDLEAVCYNTGDLGAVTMSTTSATSVLIRAADGHRHDGQLAGTTGTSGAYINSSSASPIINVGVAHVTIDGLTVNRSSGSNYLISFGSGAGGWTVKNCILRQNGGTTAVLVNDAATGASGVNRTYINNIAHYADAVTVAPGTNAIIIGDGGSSILTAANNTVLHNGKATVGMSINCTNASSLVANNAVPGFDGATTYSFGDVNDPGHVATYSHNATEDSGSAFYGDANDAAIGDADFTSTTDPTPSAGSPLIDGGTTVAVVTTDALGASRPQGLRYDIGAIEILQAYVPPGGSFDMASGNLSAVLSVGLSSMLYATLSGFPPYRQN